MTGDALIKWDLIREVNTVANETLVTPCCQTKIEPGAGFEGVDCCGQHFTRDDLED